MQLHCGPRVIDAGASPINRGQELSTEEVTERMVADQEVAHFIGSTFRSIWTIELLLHRKRQSNRMWPMADLVTAMRANESVVWNGLPSLLAAGLVVLDEEGFSRYAPVSPEMERLIEATEALYAKKRDAVRRVIVTSATDGVAVFADAFRLKRD